MLISTYLDDAMLQVPFSQFQRLEKGRLSKRDGGCGR